MSNQPQLAIQKPQSFYTETVLGRIREMEEGGLKVPADYNAANALNIAYLKINEMKEKNGTPVLATVTASSVVQALLNMAIQGLSPAKDQCYFIKYGNELTMQRSYFGTQTAVKRLDNVNEVWANVIFQGDEFEMTIDDQGIERFVKHETNWMNRDNPIMGAYAIVDTKEQGELLTVMTWKEIQQSWNQSRNKAVQEKFPQEMAKRTVIQRAAKNVLNTSKDNDYLVSAINQTTEEQYQRDEVKPEVKDVTESAIEKRFKAIKGEEAEEKPLEDFPEEVEEDEGTITAEELIAEIKEAEEAEEAEEVEAEVVEEVEQPNYSRKTVATLKEEMNARGILYTDNARKDELIELLEMDDRGVHDDQTSIFDELEQ